MYRTMIFAITALAFMLFSLTANLAASTNKFKQRTFRMKTSNHKSFANSFSSSRNLKVKSFSTFKPTRSISSKNVFRRSNQFSSNTRTRFLNSTVVTTRKRNHVIAVNSPGRKSGFDKSNFNTVNVNDKFVSKRTALDNEF
jgi:hypothetical protein